MDNSVTLSLGKILDDLDKSFGFESAKSFLPLRYGNKSDIRNYEELSDSYNMDLYVPSYNKSNVAVKVEKNIVSVSSTKNDEEGQAFGEFFNVTAEISDFTQSWTRVLIKAYN